MVEVSQSETGKLSYARPRRRRLEWVRKKMERGGSSDLISGGVAGAGEQTRQYFSPSQIYI